MQALRGDSKKRKYKKEGRENNVQHYRHEIGNNMSKRIVGNFCISLEIQLSGSKKSYCLKQLHQRRILFIVNSVVRSVGVPVDLSIVGRGTSTIL